MRPTTDNTASNLEEARAQKHCRDDRLRRRVRPARGVRRAELARQRDRESHEESQRAEEADRTRSIVVAAKPLRFGNELTAAHLREVPWPESDLPNGSFAKISDVLKDGKRVVLAAIEHNEPLLSVKITGAGQRATLSALVAAARDQ